MEKKRVNPLRTLVTSGLIAAILASIGAVNAAEIREQSFRFASAQVSEHPFTMAGQRFAEVIAEKTGGKMKAKLYAAATLGGDAQVISSLQGGTVDATFVTAGLISPMDKNFGIFYLPMTFQTPEQADKVVDGPFGKKLLDRLANQNLVGLAWWEHGYRDVSNSKRPITKLEDFQGLKLRTIQIPIIVDIYKALGANPVPLAWTEVYTALEVKAVDGQETAIPSFNGARLAEVQKYLSLTNVVYDPLIVLFSKKTWDRLNSDEKKVVTEAAQEATLYQRKINREVIESVTKSPKGGLAVNEVSAAEKKRMRERVQPVIDAYSKDFDPQLLKEFWSELAKAQK